MAQKSIFKCSAEELKALVEQYFIECEENSRKPTAPGLCVRLGITVTKFIGIVGGKNCGAYARVLQMAQLRLIDDIEQRTDSMSVSRAKLPVYTLSQSGEESGVTINLVLGGIAKGEKPFD